MIPLKDVLRDVLARLNRVVTYGEASLNDLSTAINNIKAVIEVIDLNTRAKETETNGENDSNNE